MKKLLILICLFTALAPAAKAQDIIILRNGTEIEARVLEVNVDNIRYRKFSNPDGPVYTEAKYNVVMIRYANGEKDIFSGYSRYARSSEPTTSEYIRKRVAPEGIRPAMSYREYVGKYDTRDYDRYEPERYSPYLAGVCSYLIPGLGQGICGEWMRGVCMMTGIIASFACCAAFADGSDETSTIFGIAGAGLWVWNILDAVKVSKVKNMYLNDTAQMQSDINLSASPFVSFAPVGAGGRQAPAAGLSLRINF